MSDVAGRRSPSRVDWGALAILLAIYLALGTLYCWQAWQRETPTIFSDELELTQLARSIGEGGEAARRGEPRGFTTIVPWLQAPAWWIDDVSNAYSTLKYVQALVMAAVIFPAFLLARLVVSRPWALFAAVATTVTPALAYSPILVEEPFAYPAAAVALWLLVRATARPSAWSLALAGAASVVAALTRSQLAALVLVFLGCCAWLGWSSERARRWRTAWTAWDWAGAAMLALGAVLLVSAAMGHVSEEWFITTTYWKGRILEYGVWAAGAFAVGVGVLPVVATIASLAGVRRLRDEPYIRAFGVVTLVGLLSFGWYAALKGAYLSTVFGSFVVERNLIYLAPVVFTGTALVLSRGAASWWSVVAAGALTAWWIAATPTKIELYPYYEAHGLSILAFFNREWSWSGARIESTLLWLVVLATLGLVGYLVLRRRSAPAARVAAVGVAAFLLAWNMTNQIYAANGERQTSDLFAENFPQPWEWVDDATGGGSTVVLGQQFNPTGDLNINLLEFWNRSIEKVWSADPESAAPGPGPTVTPDLAAADGTLTPTPGTEYALAVNGVALQAPEVARNRGSTLYRIDGGPLRLAHSQTGVASDGWMSDRAAYNRFDVEPGARGFVKVTLSRESWCGEDVPGNITVRVGPLTIGDDRQPALAEVSDEQRTEIHSCERKVLLLRAPEGPWRAEVTLSPTFVPAELDPSLSDRRSLGAVTGFDFVPVG